MEFDSTILGKKGVRKSSGPRSLSSLLSGDIGGGVMDAVSPPHSGEAVDSASVELGNPPRFQDHSDWISSSKTSIPQRFYNQSEIDLEELEENEPELMSTSQCIFGERDVEQLFENQSAPSMEAKDVEANRFSGFSSSTGTGEVGSDMLQRKLRQLEQDNIELSKEIERLNGNEFSEKVSSLELEGLQTEIKLLRERNSKAEQALAFHKMQAEKSALISSQFAELKNEIGVENESKKLLEERLHRQMAEQSTLKSELLAGRTETNQLRMELHKSKVECESTQQQMVHLKDEITKLTNAKSLQLTAAESKAKELEAEKVALEAHVKQLFNEVNSKIQLENQLKVDVFNLERKLAHAESETSNLRHRIAELESAERALMQTTAENDSLRNEMKKLLTEVSTLRAEANTRAALQSLPPPSTYSTSTVSSYDNFVSPPIPTPLLSSSRYSLGASDNNKPRGVSSNVSAELPSSSYVAKPQRRASLGEFSTRNSQDSSLLGVEPPPRVDYIESRYVGSSDQVGYSQRSSSGQSEPLRSSAGPQSLSAILGKDGGVGGRYSGGELGSPGDSYLSSSSFQQDNISPRAQSITGTNMRKSGYTAGSGNASPFATDLSGQAMSSAFEKLDRKLTELMQEKTTLQEESERLHQRGGKNLKDRTRLSVVEQRLSELAKEIGSTRKMLSSKPG